jgi:hypothetical protein
VNNNTNALDTVSIISNIASNQLPALSASSYVRLVPLLIATLVAVISLGICSFLLPGNSKKTLQRRALFRLISALTSIGAILVSITFGITFYRYNTNIKYACSLLLLQHQTSQYICSSYTPGMGIILLAISIGLFIISSIYCIICSISPLSKTSKLQHTNTGSNFSIYTDSNQEQAAVVNEKQILPPTMYDYNETPQRMSLRPPPPQNQKKSKCKSIVAADKVPSSGSDISNTEGRVPSMGLTPTITNSSEYLVDEDVLLPPNLPFASRQNRARGSSTQNRPLSYGSNNTFGALGGTGSQPNSPSADETASQASSYMDLHHARLYRNDSNISAGTQAPTSTNTIYSTPGTMSNHTLGATLYTNSKSSGYYVNSSFSGDEDDKTQSNNPRPRQFGSASSSMHSNFIPDRTSSGVDSLLYKRIEDYLHVQDKKKDSSSSLSN